MRIDELEAHEQLALGGLLRLMVRSDGSFSEAEEAQIDALGEGIGGREVIWRIISRSAQELRSDDAAREAAKAVTRPAARAAITDALAKVAAGDEVVKEETRLLDWLATLWS